MNRRIDFFRVLSPPIFLSLMACAGPRAREAETVPAWVQRGTAAVKTAEGDHFEGVGKTEEAARLAAYDLAKKHFDTMARIYMESTTAGNLPNEDQEQWIPRKPPRWQDPLFLLAKKTPPTTRWKSPAGTPSILVRIPLTEAVKTVLAQGNLDHKIEQYYRHNALIAFDSSAVQLGPEPAWAQRGSAAVKTAEGRFFEGVGFGSVSSSETWRDGREMARDEIGKLARAHIAAASWMSPPYMPAPTPEEMKIASESPRPGP